MNNKAYPITYNSEHYTVMANDIVKGKQDMTLQEARIIRLLITQVVKEDKDLKTYVCTVKDFAKFLNISSSNIYRDIRSICDSLLQKVVRVGTGNPKDPWEIFQWVQLAKYDGQNIKLMLSEQIKPYVIELDKYFTQYKLLNILAMDSYYAIRFYELLKCEEGLTRGNKEYLEFTIEELRKFFDCENKLVRISQFKEKVIEIAVREINQKTDIFVEYEEKKVGRSIYSMKFYLSFNHPLKRDYQLSLLTNEK